MLLLKFIVWSVMGFVILAMFCVEEDADNFIANASSCDFLNPIYIYESVNVNWFGCFWITLVVNLLCPVVTICYWFYKLCTVGRKDENE